MKSLLVIVATALVVAACGSTAEPDTTTPVTTEPTPATVPFQAGETVRLDVPLASAEPTAGDLAAVVRGDTALGLDLLRQVAGEDNTMLSPYSIASALSMLYPGARGETAEEIAAVLHLEVSDEALHEARNALERALTADPEPQRPDDDRVPFTIRPANSAWGQGGYSFLDEYLRVLATYYGAGLRLLDFAADPDGSREIVNTWVEDATEDRIQDLLPDGAIDGATRLVLVNAIWFKANWAEQFDPSLTTDDPFTLIDGSSVRVPMMHGSFRTGYVSNDLFEAVRLPYAGDAAMVVAIPANGSLSELVANLTPEDMAVEWGGYQVKTAIPSFEFDAEIPLKVALEELGMVKAFVDPFTGDGADLTGITELRELFVTNALHKTFIAVDEVGTEAAAATALVVGLTSLPQPATFTADQPFVFWIEHNTTGEVLFLGQVTDPR